MDNENLYTIYCLELHDEKYYVGRTSSKELRINSHFKGAGSQWTKKYPVKRIKWIKDDCSPYDEHKYTIQMMEKYGIDNVRGASYSRIRLDDEEIESIKKQIWNARDLCFKCGGNHFVRFCKTTRAQKEGDSNICKIVPVEPQGWSTWIYNFLMPFWKRV